MIELIFFFACVGVLVFLFIQMKKKLFDPFIAASKLRFSIWNWTKRVILIALSISLLISTFERWYYFHDEIAYSEKSLEVDPSYADQIEVEAYMTDEENLAEIFKGNLPELKVEQPDKNKNSSNSVRYMVIRIKNKGDLPIYGILEDSNPRGIQDVNVPPLPPHMSDFKNIVLWKYWANRDSSVPYSTLDLKWKQIYTLKGDK